MTKEPTIREILENVLDDYTAQQERGNVKDLKVIIDLAHQEIRKKIPSVEEIRRIVKANACYADECMEVIARKIHNLLEERLR
ncbi:hypothetical protein CCP1ISM_50032 [Azospirillaceae bacterium]